MVRFSDEAKQNAIDEAHALFEYTGDQADGLSLYDDFFAHAATLATLPERYARLPEESQLLGVELRRLIVRGRFDLYYRIENGDDGPIVFIRSGYRFCST